MEPGLIQTPTPIVADLAKAGIRVKRSTSAKHGAVREPASRDGKAGPMFDWSVGLLLGLRRRRDPLRRVQRAASLQLLLQQGARRPGHPGPLHARRQEAAEIYVKAQKLIFDDAAYLYKWGLRGVWGVSNRIDYQAPADEVDRMFLVTPAEEVGDADRPGRPGRRRCLPGSAGIVQGGRPAMRRYVAPPARRSSSVVILGISMLAFAILHVLGDPVTLLLPQNAGKEEYERYHKLLGLDRPLYVQYWKFASRAVLGDFGKSWYADTPAFKLVIERMPPTIYLTFAGLVIALLISLPLGILAALKRHSLAWTASARGGGGGPGHADLLARHHADHHLRGAPPAPARLRLRHLAALPHARLHAWARSWPRSRCAWCAPASSRS